LSKTKAMQLAISFNQKMAKSPRVGVTQRIMGKVSPSSHMLCGNSEWMRCVPYRI